MQTKRNPKAYFNYRFELLNAVKPHPEQFLTLHPEIYQEACQVVRNLSHNFSKNELAKRKEREREDNGRDPERFVIELEGTLVSKDHAIMIFHSGSQDDLESCLRAFFLLLIGPVRYIRVETRSSLKSQREPTSTKFSFFFFLSFFFFFFFFFFFYNFNISSSLNRLISSFNRRLTNLYCWN